MGVNKIEILINNPNGDQNEELIAYNKKNWYKIIEFLLKNDYEIKIIYDGLCVLIEFELCPEVYGGPRLKWVDEDE